MIERTLVADAQHKEMAYRGLAKFYALSEETWLALHSQIKADLAAATLVLKEDPTLVGHDNHSALAQRLRDEAPLLSGREGDAVEYLISFRNLFEHLIPEDTRNSWRSRLANIDFMESLPAASVDRVKEMKAARLRGLEAETLVENLYSEADARMEQASGLLSSDNVWDAIVAAYESDLAAFEGWLISRSLLVGDENLVQVEMRWTLAVQALADLPTLPNDFTEATALVRSRLAWVVGPTDARDLSKNLALLPQ